MSVFEIIYHGGFAMTDSLEVLAYLMKNNTALEVMEMPSLEVAYVDACRRYVEANLRENLNRRVLLPKFEDVRRTPFYDPSFTRSIPVRRYFAIFHHDYAGIFTSVEKAMDFMATFHPSSLREFVIIDHARDWLAYECLRRVLPMGAYLTGGIPYLAALPLDVAVSLPYAQWLADHYHPVYELPFSTENPFLSVAGTNSSTLFAKDVRQEHE